MWLAPNVTPYIDGACAIELTAGANQGLIVPMSESTTLLYIGHFKEHFTSSASSVECNIDLITPIDLQWYLNTASPNNVASTDIGQVCYFVDANHVSITSTSRSLAGRVWAVDTTKGVLVQKLSGSQLTVQTGNIASNQVAHGTAYQILRTNAGATASEWAADPLSYGTIDATNDITVVIADGFTRRITASGDGKNITVGTTGARAGMQMTIMRAALGSTTACNVLNGGAGTGTLMAMTSNKAASCTIAFDGTNWALACGTYQAA
jgi:hypothetical protein